MTEEQIRNTAIAELTKPTLGGTEQYLEIHSAVKENGAIKVERIDLEGKDDIAIVYIPVEEEYTVQKIGFPNLFNLQENNYQRWTFHLMTVIFKACRNFTEGPMTKK